MITAIKNRYLTTVAFLFLRDLLVFKKGFWRYLLDTYILLITSVVVYSYFLKLYGISADYGPFILMGMIARFGFYEVIGKVGVMISDIEEDRTILYTLGLPIPASLALLYIPLSWALLASIVSFLQFPVGKLILFSQFDLSRVDFSRLTLIFFLSNIFFGFFGLWLVSIIKKPNNPSYLHVRIINPLYMFGAFLYSWQAAYDISPIIGYLQLINPLVYVMEGFRAAALGQDGYLPFWFSCTALVTLSIGMGLHAIHRLKRRLDCA